MTMILSSFTVTTCCSVVFRLPESFALPRIRCTVSISSVFWPRKASPRS